MCLELFIADDGPHQRQSALVRVQHIHCAFGSLVCLLLKILLSKAITLTVG